MRILLPAAMSIVLCGLAVTFAGAQQAARGTLAGAIVDDETGVSVAGAEVRLTRVAGAAPAGVGGTAPPPLPPLPAITDSQGRFTIHGVEPGSYRASVFAEGYVRQDYGQRVGDGVQGSSTVVRVTAGATAADITVRLIATGVVTGRIVDRAGRPVAGLDVQLLSPAYDANGDRRLNTAGSGGTNDRGEYRIYWVTPGRYYVAAGSGRLAPGPIVESGVTFFPGVRDPEQAEPITVRPRGEVNIDLVVSREQYRVRGVVFDAETGHASSSVRIELQPSRFLTGPGFSSMLRLVPVYNPADGTFEVRDVPPGRYYASAIVQGPGSAMRRSRPVPVTVSSADVDGVTTAFEPSVSVPGRVRVEGGGPLPTPARPDFPLVYLHASLGGTRLADVPSGTIGGSPAADGTFTLRDVLPGEYRLSVPPRPEYVDYYVKEARYGDADALDAAIVVDASRPQMLDIVMSASTGRITGAVVDAADQPVSGQQVVLVPDRHRDRTELYRVIMADAVGRFTIAGVAPGDYRLFAWDALAPNAYYDQQVVATYEPQGTPVHVAESSVVSAGVRIIAAR